MDTLTTTSYAVLAHLAVQPWSAYDLAGQLTRGFDLVWPRAESQVYEEPKRLARLGLAEASNANTGKRRRTVYTITPQGRDALADWLSTPTEQTRSDSEPLIRVFFAEHGTSGDLLATIDAVADQARQVRQRLADQIHGYLDHEGPYPQRWHVIGLGAGALLAQAKAWEAWAEESRKRVETWPSDPAAAGQDGRKMLHHLVEAFDLKPSHDET